MAAMALAADATGAAPRFDVLEPSSSGGEILAIGPTESEGVFVAYVKGAGFKYLHFQRKGQWHSAAFYAGPIAGELGLLVGRGEDGDSPTSRVSFVEASGQAWVCLSLPGAGELADAVAGEAKVVARTSLPAAAAAVCAAPGDATAAVALTSGTVRFMELATGKAAGKGLKLETPEGHSGDTAPQLARLGPGRAAVVRAVGSNVEFFVLHFDAEAQRTALQLRGTFRVVAGPPPAGPLLGAALADPTPKAGEERLLLCWGASGDSGPSFASVTLDGEAPAMLPFLPDNSAAGASSVLWQSINGYLVRWRRSSESGKPLELTLADSRFGMLAGTGEVQLRVPEGGAVLAATSGEFSAVACGTAVVMVQWSLPTFSLQMVIGRSVTPTLHESQKTLAPLHEAILGKRPRDDTEVEQMFSAKRHAISDAALSSEVRARRWLPSHELVDVILRHKCWGTARALFTLPELDEDLAVRLLAGHVELLARVVRRSRSSSLMDLALRNHLPTVMLPQILELLFEWINAYRDFSHETLQQVAPGLPDLEDMTVFLQALADGCLLSLLRLDADVLERMVEVLTFAKASCERNERVYTTLRAACRIRKPMRAIGDNPSVEVAFVDF